MSELIHVKDFNKFELNDMLEGKYLELLIDTRRKWDKAVFHVHPPLGHSAAAAIYLEIKEEKLNTENAGHLVSVLVEIEERTVKKVMIGRSSLEIKNPKHPRIEHTSNQLMRARKRVEMVMYLSKQLGEIILPVDIKEHEFIFN